MNQISPSTSMPLSPGAVWRGKQTSGRAEYDVEVRICSVTETGDLCGTLTIRNLTPSLPKVVTYFDGEVIGKHHSFTTDKWGASEDDDDAHWGRFKRDIYLKGDTDIAECESVDKLENAVFMRLKERCFLNANKEQDLSGASFSGFYYIAVELNPSSTTPQHALSRDLSHLVPPGMYSTIPASPHALHTRGRSTTLERSDSYASIVRGRSPACPISIPTARNIKVDETVTVSVGVAISTGRTSVYSPPIDEYPLPSGPSSLPAFPFERDGLIARPATRRAASTGSHSQTDVSTPASSNFYCRETGYTGPWAHATMRGFYFASSSDPYQELKLRYVGDGMGAILEETEEEAEKFDEWGCHLAVDKKGMLQSEFGRRERYMQSKGSASFTVL